MSEFFPRCVSTVSQIPTKCFAGCHHRSHQWRWPVSGVIRLLGNESLHRDIPLIFRNIIAMLTSQLSLCVIAVDWSGYPSQEHHVLRASLLCDGRSLPLLSWIVPSEKQQNSQIQKNFLDALAEAVNPVARVIIVTDAGFQSAWFRRQELQVRSKPEYLGTGTLAVRNMPGVMAIFICIKKSRKAGRITAHVAA